MSDVADFSAAVAARAGEGALFPILEDGCRAKLPWAAFAPHEEQALRNHDQTLQMLARRGGLSWCEACAVLEDRPYHKMDGLAARVRVMELVNAARSGSVSAGVDPGIEAAAIELHGLHFGENMTWAEASDRLRALWRSKAERAIAAWKAATAGRT